MTRQHWQRVEHLYHAALEREPDERTAFLKDACQGDDKVRQEVESLLCYEGREHEILSRPVWARASGVPALAPGVLLGDYRIIGSLGSGGMGEVYRARDLKLGRDVALKILPEAFASDPGRLARFEREAQVLASLNHPNIAAIFGIEEAHGVRALILELVEGPTLADRIARGPLPIDEALAIAWQIVHALEYAHEKGVVHRDLKPANVKIRPADDTVKVLDFGLAKAAREPGSASHPAELPTLPGDTGSEGLILGTAAYMSPEQARGRQVDKRSDIWSFGALLYEMLSGRRPFGGETISDTLASVLREEPDWKRIPEVPARLLRKCLEKDPKRRLRDIGDAQWVLNEASEGKQSPPVPRRWFSTFVAALILVAAAVLAVRPFRNKPPVTELVRFLVPVPANTHLSTYPPRLSPDGRRLAFSAAGVDGRVFVWVRDLNSLDAQPLGGTEDATSFFWSPDSHFLVFGAGGKLKKIEVSGGRPESLCDAPVPVLGGSWNRQNEIIFGGAMGSAILRVSAAGGGASAVTTIDKSGLELFHTYPSFLPDGRHFLYLRVGVNHRGVYVGSLDAKPDSQDSKQLLATGYSPAYAPGVDPATGHLLFIRDFTLMAQTFDARRLELTGEPVPIAEPVLTYRTDGYFSVSSNGILVYRAGGGRNTQLAWFDRDGRALGTVAEAGEYREVALSPDEARVAVSRRDPQTQDFRFDIWQVELSRAANTPITFHSSLSGSPVWSPDSRRIAFFTRGRDGVSTLLQKAANGAGNEESFVRSSDEKYPTDWSRDGNFLLYSDVDPKTKSDLWVLPLKGDRKPTAYLRTEFDESQGQFAPDTRWIAYVSNETGRREVWVQPFDSSSAPRAKWMISSGGGSQPRWRRDGRELFYLSTDRKLMAVDVTTQPTFQTSVPRPLFTVPVFTSPADVQRYDVTGDGKRFLIIADAGDTALTPITVVLNWTALLRR